MRKKIPYLLLFFLITGIGFLFAVRHRNSLRSLDLTPEALSDYRVDFLFGNEETASASSDIEKMIEEADAVLTAQATGVRRFSKEDTLTEVTVTRIWKDYPDLYVGKTLQILEPVYLNNYPGNFYIALRTPCNLMQEGQSYILFLNFDRKPEGYRYSESERSRFLVTRGGAGLFPDVNEIRYRIVDPKMESSKWSCRELENYDCFFADEESARKYEQTVRDLRELILPAVSSPAQGS